MTDYHITIRVGRSGAAGGGGKRSEVCDWECAYCGGSGRDPAGILGTETCSACGGFGWWTADVSCDRLRRCGRCRGTGRIDSFGFLKKCDVCGGAGKG